MVAVWEDFLQTRNVVWLQVDALSHKFDEPMKSQACCTLLENILRYGRRPRHGQTTDFGRVQLMQATNKPTHNPDPTETEYCELSFIPILLILFTLGLGFKLHPLDA